MHERDAAAADQRPERARVASQRAGDGREPGRVHQLAAQHAQRPREHLDAGPLELVRELAAIREHDDRLIARAVEPGGDQRELAIGSVAPARGVDQQDGARAQSSTVSAGAGASGTSSGWRMLASSSSPSTIRGPGREK